MIAFEQYKKIQEFLLQNGQQELAGHLDGMWQELQQYNSLPPTDQPLEEGTTPEPSARISSQDFQDQASAEDPAPTE